MHSGEPVREAYHALAIHAPCTTSTALSAAIRTAGHNRRERFPGEALHPSGSRNPDPGNGRLVRGRSAPTSIQGRWAWSGLREPPASPGARDPDRAFSAATTATCKAVRLCRPAPGSAGSSTADLPIAKLGKLALIDHQDQAQTLRPWPAENRLPAPTLGHHRSIATARTRHAPIRKQRAQEREVSIWAWSWEFYADRKSELSGGLRRRSIHFDDAW